MVFSLYILYIFTVNPLPRMLSYLSFWILLLRLCSVVFRPFYVELFYFYLFSLLSSFSFCGVTSFVDFTSAFLRPVTYLSQSSIKFLKCNLYRVCLINSLGLTLEFVKFSSCTFTLCSQIAFLFPFYIRVWFHQ